MKRLAFVVLGLFGCAPSVDVDQDERELAPPPQVEFDPAGSVVPFPNDLLLTNGRVSLPAQCGETPASAALRQSTLNQLDGFGAFKVPLTVTFGAAVDTTSLAGRVFLVRVAEQGSLLVPGGEAPVPLVALPGVTQRFDAACSAALPIDLVTFVPAAPLVGASTYAVVLLDGILTTSGEPFSPSSTWALVRQDVPPVTVGPEGAVLTNDTPLDPAVPEQLTQLRGLAQLWQLYAPLLGYVTAAVGAEVNGSAAAPVDRDDVLLAWAFDTQTLVQPLDTATPDSPAALQLDPSLDGITVAETIAGPQVPEAIESVIGAGLCTQLPCGQVGAILLGTLESNNFQPGSIPGPFDDHYEPSGASVATLPFVAFVPDDAFVPAPTNGRPLIIFGHGLGGSKANLFAIGSQLAAAGFASVAIDWVAHGDRAVQITHSSILGCSGTPNPTLAPQCFAPIFSTDLATTRDNLRQSVLDLQRLAHAVTACAPSGDCGALHVDSQRIGYLGQSLGALLGAVVVATTPDVSAAVLNVGGAGLIDVIVNSDTPAIKCPLVDSLITAGVLVGQQWNGTNPTALCLGDTWQAQPAFQQFAAAARWVLDPAEPANFASRLLATPPVVLLQEVLGDEVIPNVATEQLAALLGLTPVPAHTGAPVAPSGGAGTGATAQTNAWITYIDDTDGDFYSHASLLLPSDENGDDDNAEGLLGTLQMQTDAITYFVSNL